ncbi:MAG: hypothetical protein A3B15_00770 [Candidatus Buchananbacteria bacterium RIFCSPLOWO2_01_FULL_45_31]|uniref:Uncharacterized protein n=1 Tax=Candidatus Buchananbacteria bacterium RIFCSPLOWO2_01_FULL_45_31 TaxID=1797545 RepID=A0A1G1YQ72_9BACT|nr:MAG: hypothetical protein A3B15_00770 [Candidatus Buchananbacteria bacterium RIFCSPLOWO2_01_FULL_45_31]
MSQQVLSSQYLHWFQKIERSLWTLFRLFDDLCGECYSLTIRQADSGERSKRSYWCCCLIDNQVHDNWPKLDAVQSRSDRHWYQKLGLKKISLVNRRLPGNGPCPALGDKGCQIGHYRPIACTTQLCEKMLFILTEAQLISGPIDSPRQIEDLISLPDILPTLYGCQKNRPVTEQEVRAYLATVAQLTAKLANVDVDQRRALAIRAIAHFMKQGGKNDETFNV